jgi:hypothetical protein
MATHDYDLANASGASFRTDLNNCLDAILSNNSSSSAPSTTVAYMLWADTTAGVLKIRNSANNGWVSLMQLDGTQLLEDGSAGSPGLCFLDDTNTGMFSSAADKINFSTGGTERLEIDSSGLSIAGGISMTANLDMQDNDKVLLGSSDDLEIYHDGSNSFIDDSGTGGLYLRSNQTQISKYTGETCAKFIADGACELYHDNAKKLDTYNLGVRLGSTASGASSEVQVGTMASGNRYSLIDLVGDDTYTDYGLRLIRHNGGANTFSQLTHRGTGELQIHVQDSGFIGFHTNNNVRVRVDSSGHVLFGQTTSSIPGLGNTTVGASFEKTSSGGAFFSSRADGPAHFMNRNSNGAVVEFFRSGTARGSIFVNTSNTTYNTSSDYRLKENIVDLTGAITRLKQLQPKRFNFISDPEATQDGFIAHEAATVIPEAVTGTHNEIRHWGESSDDVLPEGVSEGDPKLDEDGNTIPIYQGMDYGKVTPLLTAALQEAIAKIETLEAKVAALEAG